MLKLLVLVTLAVVSVAKKQPRVVLDEPSPAKRSLPKYKTGPGIINVHVVSTFTTKYLLPQNTT
jgi:hypothetical protein